MSPRDQVVSALETRGIPHRVWSHPAVFTMDDANQHWRDLRGAQCKNLFVHDRSGKKHYLIVVERHARVDLQGVRRIIGSTKLSFASDDELMHYLKLTPGSVSPLGLLFDTEKHVELILDEELKNAEFLNFHPCINTETVEITPNGLLAFIAGLGHVCQLVPVPRMAETL